MPNRQKRRRRAAVGGTRGDLACLSAQRSLLQVAAFVGGPPGSLSRLALPTPAFVLSHVLLVTHVFHEYCVSLPRCR